MTPTERIALYGHDTRAIEGNPRQFCFACRPALHQFVVQRRLFILCSGDRTARSCRSSSLSGNARPFTSRMSALGTPWCGALMSTTEPGPRHARQSLVDGDGDAMPSRALAGSPTADAGRRGLRTPRDALGTKSTLFRGREQVFSLGCAESIDVHGDRVYLRCSGTAISSARDLASIDAESPSVGSRLRLPDDAVVKQIVDGNRRREERSGRSARASVSSAPARRTLAAVAGTKSWASWSSCSWCTYRRQKDRRCNQARRSGWEEHCAYRPIRRACSRAYASRRSRQSRGCLDGDRLDLPAHITPTRTYRGRDFEQRLVSVRSAIG